MGFGLKSLGKKLFGRTKGTTTTTTPLNPNQNFINSNAVALNRLSNQGGINPIEQQQQQLLQQTLQGNFPLPNSQQFQAAVDPARQSFFDTIGQIGSGAVNAGGSGRGITQNLQGQAQGQFADSLNQFALGQYNQERQLQQQAMFANASGFDQGADDFNRRLQLLSVLQGGPTGQATTNPGASRLANIVGGSAAGAGVGGVGGGILGGLAGGLFG